MHMKKNQVVMMTEKMITMMTTGVAISDGSPF